MKCRICNATDTVYLFSKGSYEIYECSDCATVFVGDIPSEEKLKSLYNFSFFDDEQKHSLNISSAAWLNSKKRLELIRKYKRSGALLDIGCGTGVFLETIKEYYKTCGIDTSKDGTNFAKEKYKLNVVCGDFIRDFDSTGYNIITMFDTLEHVADPILYAKKVYSILNPGGIFVFTTPDVNSLMYKINKKGWHLMIPPKHLHLFSSKEICEILGNIGFDTLEVCKAGQYTNLGYMFKKLGTLSTSKASKIVTCKLVESVLKSCNIWLNLYDMMTVVCRKS